ncbi:hypothetical protein AVEN_115765-1 [Araneus ventricosus]|uniref:Uncharacterized protein n=1 Tax=Araneus ventricosus TaxID=182803 RepID=A0A4Y2FMD9_ARAVE|nr:hypothetical protein AVEN_115765-1 [Araneus ventricosus]
MPIDFTLDKAKKKQWNAFRSGREVKCNCPIYRTLGVNGMMFSLPASTAPTRKESSTFHFSRRPQVSLHLVVIKESFARVIASRGNRPQCTRINIACIAPVVRKLRNHPTVGIDH